MSKALCIIPARGGSKRIPRKNIKEFHGKPIIAYSIDIALRSGLFKEVMVSTDCEEIKGVSLEYGAHVPFLRSQANSNDFASTLDVVKEVLRSYAQLGIQFDRICVLYATAPLTQIAHLKKGYSLLSEYDGVMPVTEFSYPVLRSLKMNNGIVNYNWKEYAQSRSQDLPILYHDAGQWYWVKKECIEQNTMFPEFTFGMVLNSNEVQDIDTLNDWFLAELKYSLLYQNSPLINLENEDSE